jgi:hypothetical protein
VRGEGISENAVFVRIKKTSLERPITLLLTAYGTA